MRKYSKKFFSMALAMVMTFSIIPGTDFSGMIKTVSAAESMADDSVQITTDIIPDAQLCYALRYIIGGDKYANITVKDLRTYTDNIDLSVYSDYDKIESLEGLGYARKASVIDASKLSKVKIIKDNEFQNCEFKKFGMPSNIVEIGKEAFFNCVNLETVDLPQSLITIQSEAFRNCKALDGVVLPQKIAKIGNNAFAICESLKSIVIPDGINATIENAGDDSAVGIGGGVFDGCINLSSVKLGAGMTAIPAGFLSNTSSLRSIEIPEKIVKIMDSAFSGSGLLSIDLSANTGITAIETAVFDKCVNLQSVKLPESIDTIEERAFNSCKSLSDFSFVSNLKKLKTIGSSAFAYCAFESIQTPESLESISSYAFYNNPNLQEVTIKDFSELEGDVIKSIGRYAFSESKQLKKVVLPTTNENNPQVKIEIGDYAFSKCKSLGSINFPANVTEIGAYAFNECGASTRILNENEEKYVNMTKLENQYVTGLKYADLSKCSQLTLGDHAFYKCINLEKVTLPKELTSIPKYAFAECATPILQSNGTQVKALGVKALEREWYHGLKTVVMGDKVSEIGDYAFNQDHSLVINGELPSSLVTIRTQAFRGCESLKSVILPRCIEYIGSYAFADTSRIANEVMSKTATLNLDASYANNLQYVGASAFEKSAIKSFIMDKNAPLTKVYERTFYDCQYLETVSLGKNIANIADAALAACLRLKSVSTYDCCTFNTNSLKGSVLGGYFTGEYGRDNFIGYTENNKVYFVTYDFNLAITPLNEHVTVRLNESSVLPLYTIAADSKGYYSQVKIADNTYSYDTSIGDLDGEKNPDKANIIPSQVKNTNKIEANKYIGKYNKDAYSVKLNGIRESRNIGIYVQAYLQLYKANNCTSIYSPTITYIADVTGVPCTEIAVDDKQCVSVATKKVLTITPEFKSEDGSEITDKIQWDILTGDDYITMTVSQDGKSVSILPKGENCGNASIKVTAGKVIKTIYVNVVAPATALVISPSGIIDMKYGAQTEITVKPSYGVKYDEIADIFPDMIKFTSGDENVVKVMETVNKEGKTVAKLLAVGSGKTVITVRAAAGNVSKNITVYVSSDNLKLNMSDGNGSEASSGSNVNIHIKKDVSYSYSLSENLGNNQLSVDNEDESIVKVSVTTTRKKVTFKPLKVGKTKITVYPTVGSKQNGITFNINVNSDISSIWLSGKSIPEGNTESVFSYMKNKFGQKITEATEENYKSITDNRVEFKSGNPENVAVDKFGNVTVKKYSESVKSVPITCNVYDDGDNLIKTASVTVTVKKPMVKSVSISGGNSVKVGESRKYKLSITPANGEYTSVSVRLVSGKNTTASWQLSSDYKTLTVKGLTTGTLVLEVKVMKYGSLLASKQIKITVSKSAIKSVAQVKWNKCKGAKNKVSLKWKKVSGATGYEIQLSQKKKNGYKKVKTIKSGKITKCTVKKLKKKKNYCFRVRAFSKTAGGSVKYGRWSKVKTVKTK